MSTILVSPDQLRAAADGVRRSSQALRQLRGRLHNAGRSFDWDVRGSSYIDERVRDSIEAADTLAGSADSMASFLVRAAQAFEDADHHGAGTLTANLAPLLQEVRQLEQLHDRWGRLHGLSFDTVQQLVNLGFLLMPGGKVVTDLLGITGTDRVDRILRGWTGSRLPVNALAGGILSLAQVMVTGKSKVWQSTPSGVDGLSFGLIQTKDGTEHSYSRVHYEKELHGEHVKFSAGAVKFEAKTTILNSGVQATGVEAKLEGQYGNDYIKAVADATGRVGTASAEYDFDIRKGRFGAEAYAAAVEGEAAGGFSIPFLGLDAKLGVKACAACIGAGAKVGAEGEIKLAGIIGLAVTWEIGPLKKKH